MTATDGVSTNLGLSHIIGRVTFTSIKPGAEFAFLRNYFVWMCPGNCINDRWQQTIKFQKLDEVNYSLVGEVQSFALGDFINILPPTHLISIDACDPM